MEQYGCRPTKGNPADQDQLGWASAQRGQHMVSQLVLPKWVKLGKNVWAAELSDADSQPTKRTLRMFYTCYAKVIPARTWFRKRSGYLGALTDTGFGGPVWVPSLSSQAGRKRCVGSRTVRRRQPTNVWDLLKVVYTS